MTIKRPGQFTYAFFKRESGPAGGSDSDMNVAASLATPSVFSYVVPVGETLLVERVNFQMVDNSIGALDFGGISGGLDNGLTIKTYNHEGGAMVDFLNGEVIKRNADFSLLAGSDMVIAELQGKDQLPIQWSIGKAGAQMQLLARESIKIIINDDLSSIDIFRAMIQGVKE
jgi:hypothetical protein